MQKLRVGVLGATGLVGQIYLEKLFGHPFFEVTFLAASKSSSNQSYQNALTKKNRPVKKGLLPYADFPVYAAEQLEVAQKNCDFVFSALDSAAALKFEELYASKGLAVISNGSAHRMAPDVPILIPELNPEHLEILEIQKKNRGWKKGFIVTKSNCSIMSYLIPLFPLHQKYRIKKLRVTTLQAISGAGYPGLSALDVLNNVIPFISGEEEKSEQEPLKILGHIHNKEISLLKDLSLSVSCNRVPVTHGHLACTSVEFESKPSIDEIKTLWKGFRGLPQQMNLPSAPKHPIHYLEGSARPQPLLDVNLEQGMSIGVGRLRPCNALHFQFTALSHNLMRGAAFGGLLNAELLYKLGYLTRCDSFVRKIQDKQSLNKALS